MYSWLSRCSTAHLYNRGVPAKVGACKSFLFTESSLVVKININVFMPQAGFKPGLDLAYS